jgi:hypothetical protein
MRKAECHRFSFDAGLVKMSSVFVFGMLSSPRLHDADFVIYVAFMRLTMFARDNVR